jgi:hypothetical protein
VRINPGNFLCDATLHRTNDGLFRGTGGDRRSKKQAHGAGDYQASWK